MYIVSNDLGVLDRAAPVWEAVGPRSIELYSINQKGPGAFKVSVDGQYTYYRGGNSARFGNAILAAYDESKNVKH